MTDRVSPKRKSIPLSVQVEVLKRMLGLDKVKIDWSHEPALQLRVINDAGTDYVPAQLDPDYIVARRCEEHDRITFKDNGTGRGDLTAIAHVRRSADDDRRHQTTMAAKVFGTPAPREDKPRRKWPTRKFNSKGKRKMARARTGA